MKNGKEPLRIIRDSKGVVSCISTMLLNCTAQTTERSAGSDLLNPFLYEMELGFE